MTRHIAAIAAAALAIASAAHAEPSIYNGPSQTANMSQTASPSQTNGQAITFTAPPASAIAPPLTFSQGTCYVSVSASGQGITLGLSASLPIEDKACTTRANAQALAALGERAAALAYLRARDPAIGRALDSAR